MASPVQFASSIVESQKQKQGDNGRAPSSSFWYANGYGFEDYPGGTGEL